jgi:hypothetical protein
MKRQTLIRKAERALLELHTAIARQRSVPYCLKLWSGFIRIRDNGRCVICRSRKETVAHHIVRKSFLIEARFQTGNGITLCKGCHRQPHEVFNRRANFDLPMDAEGGENIDLLTEFFGRLLIDAKERNMLRDDFYFLSDDVLARFKLAQGFEPDYYFGGLRLEQAFAIWDQCPQNTWAAVLGAALAFTNDH